jgi:hypothetical protein
VYATRVATESHWQLAASLFAVAAGLLAITAVGAALYLAWQRTNPWPLLFVTILLTAWTFLTLPSIGGIFILPTIVLWILAVRSLRRGH